MGILNNLAIILSILFLFLLSGKRLRHSSQWRATVTPLASIIGSGFLIVAPLLHSVFGKWALVGISILLLLAYAIGAVVRFNICHAETHLMNQPHDSVAKLETTSQLFLGIAFAISVAFYTSLFIAFVFDRFSIVNPLYVQFATTGLLLVIMAIAWWRGEHGLETIELVAVTIKLAIIIGVILALASYDVIIGIVWFEHNAIKQLSFWDTLAMLAGMLMVTQGFETARYMGASYDKKTRINAVRYSQWIAAIIYILFIGFTCPIFLEFPIVELNETTISHTLGQILIVLPIMLLIAAVASQLSAALADTIGGGGLLKELLPVNLPDNIFYTIVIVIAIVLIWSANIFEIINYASKGFAIYYLLQVLISIRLIKKNIVHSNNLLWMSGCYLLLFILLFVIFGSIPAPHS
jgi:hypothetical protein